MPRSKPVLAALFISLLVGCGGKDAASGSDSDSETSDPSGTTDTSDPSGSSSTSDPSGPASNSDSSDEPVCVYGDDEFVITPEQYEQWLLGEDSETTDTDGETDGTTDAGTTDSEPETGETGGEPSIPPEELDQTLCASLCEEFADVGLWVETCEFKGYTEEGDYTFYCRWLEQACDGRRHVCVESRGESWAPGEAGGFFARAAHDEAASVHAFLALAHELEAHNAPASLVARARTAASDELRHTRAIGRLAADLGAHLAPPTIVRKPVRALLDIAIENAVEGCVGETWAALMAAHQARTATLEPVRTTMGKVAVDELRHAELAWELAQWFRARLTPEQWREVEFAQREAAKKLLIQQVVRPEGAWALEVGLPTAAQATALARGMVRELWAA